MSSMVTDKFSYRTPCYQQNLNNVHKDILVIVNRIGKVLIAILDPYGSKVCRWLYISLGAFIGGDKVKRHFFLKLESSAANIEQSFCGNKTTLQ